MKSLIWAVVTRIAIACAAYINMYRHMPPGKLCEDCADWGKWKRCENCVYQLGGTKKNNWRAK